MISSFDSIFFQIQWRCTSICLVRWWNWGFTVSKIAPLLLVFRLNSWPGSLYPTAAKNWSNYKASFSASVIAIYSISVEDRVTVTCCFDWWDTNPAERRKKYPPFDLHSSLSPVQSESVCPNSSSVIFDLKVIPSSYVQAKYWKIPITKLQFIGLGFVQYRIRNPTESEISSRVCTAGHIR